MGRQALFFPAQNSYPRQRRQNIQFTGFRAFHKLDKQDIHAASRCADRQADRRRRFAFPISAIDMNEPFFHSCLPCR
jgi:hypothetical protein